jgi:hypothetical protein
MIDITQFNKLTELEEIEKAVFVTRTLGNGRTMRCRVEAHRDPRGRYSTTVYRELEIIVQPSEIANGKQLPPERCTIWVREPAPWTDRPTADDAIKQLFSLWEN